MELSRIPLNTLKGISTAREKLFAAAEIHSIDDLLHYYPRDYENRAVRYDCAGAPDGECVSLVLEVITPLTDMRRKDPRTGKLGSIQKCVAADASGSVTLIYFNRPFLKDTLLKGRTFRFTGILRRTPQGLSMPSPVLEAVYENESLPDLVPVYPLTEGLTGNLLTAAIRQALEKYKDDIRETRSPLFLEQHGFPPLYDALCAVHMPKDTEQLENARRRLAFEELCDFFLKTAKLSSGVSEGRAPRIKYPDMRAFTAKLPFTLTLAQKHAIQDILVDMTHRKEPEPASLPVTGYVPPARRLVQGDVGSGKTMVACAAVYAVAMSGFQAALMAPTGILAAQHYEQFDKLLSQFGISCVLLTGGMKESEKREILARIKRGCVQVVIGTHALIEENVVFHNLALAITDEQHRFGVMQRGALENKAADGLLPHIVVMSATPIPRTLAMILYCGLDVSIIDQMPKGRKPIETFAVGEEKRTRMYTFLAGLIAAGRQAYIVCPLAETDPDAVMPEDYELKAAKDYCASLASTPLGNTHYAYIHGKMKPAEKDEIMARFAAGEIEVLVSTTVIEVGVNVPNAVVMLVENAERFGLSQLHQLRGRVGRGSEKSYCILMSPLLKRKSGDSDFAKRMDILCKNTSGFVIAEKDLQLRGPGEFFGKRQSGMFRFRIADMKRDGALISLAKSEAVKQVNGGCEDTFPIAPIQKGRNGFDQ